MDKKARVESINGKESVEDLIAMVNRQDNPNGVIAMICMTTKITNPATFNQFKRELKKNRPDLFDDPAIAKLLNFGDSSSSNNSGCFIATATLGDHNHPLVIDLRKFRDEYLLRSKTGNLFIKVYYFFGPYFAGLISRFKLLRLLSLNLLIKPLHKLIKKNLLK